MGAGTLEMWPGRRATLELDGDVLEAVRREAARAGRSEDEVVEEAIRC